MTTHEFRDSIASGCHVRTVHGGWSFNATVHGPRGGYIGTVTRRQVSDYRRAVIREGLPVLVELMVGKDGKDMGTIKRQERA